MKTSSQLIEQLVQIRLDEALGNLNKLPKGYKLLVQYALKTLNTRDLRVSENSEIEMIENVTGSKLTQALNKAVDKANTQIGFFIISDTNGYKLYVPEPSDGEKISKTSKFALDSQEMPPSYEINVGPMKPQFSANYGTGRHSSWKPYRLRDLVNLSDDQTYSLYVVYQDPTVLAKMDSRSKVINDPLSKSHFSVKQQTQLMAGLRDKLPAYKASKFEVVDFDTITVSGLYDLIGRAPKRDAWSGTVNIRVKGIDGACEFRGAERFNMTRDGVFVGNLRVESGSDKSIYLTTTGFVLK
jgi:hypothetical protein